MKGRIRTLRGYPNRREFDLVFEWEDQIQKELEYDLFYSKDFVIGQRPVLQKISRMGGINLTDIGISKFPTFAFDMEATTDMKPIYKKNVVLSVIDFYLPFEHISKFCKLCSRNKFVFVSSRQVYNRIKQVEPSFPLGHLPLTLPNKYRFNIEKNEQRIYDVAIMGHTSAVLQNWLKEYQKKFSINVIFRKQVDHKFVAISQTGSVVAPLESRAQYFDLLRRTKVVLYNTSGMDDSRLNTEGYNQVTPRFLEYLSSGCHVISRYIDNDDTDYFELPKMTRNIMSYEDFKNELDYCLHTDIEAEKYRKYLDKHYTSKIMSEIKSKMEG